VSSSCSLYRRRPVCVTSSVLYTCLSRRLFYFNDTPTTETYTLSLHDALPISARPSRSRVSRFCRTPHRSSTSVRSSPRRPRVPRSEEHTSELQSPDHLVCRLLLEKKKETIVLIAQTIEQLEQHALTKSLETVQ